MLLDQHRVLMSDQLARLTGAAARTVTYRLDRLLQARLVAFARPGREAGSSPRFWWLAEQLGDPVARPRTRTWSTRTSTRSPLGTRGWPGRSSPGPNPR